MDKKKFYIDKEGVIEVTPFFDKQEKKYGDFIELTFYLLNFLSLT